MRRLAAACLITVAFLTCPLVADPVPQYRAFWVDTFNTNLNSHADVVATVNNAKLANANAIFAQVRRRADSWFLNALEPPPDFTPLATGSFDALADLIAVAHANGIEVHAFCIVGSVWNKNPTFAPAPGTSLGSPLNANHVFNTHGGYDPVTKTINPGPNNWLTRSLLADGTASVAFNGHRVGAEFWLDLGHPAAAEFTYQALMQLVRNYDVDGLHFDRIRFPELSVSGQTPTSGASIGYNTTSIARFQTFNNIPAGSAPPATGDARWMQWRRDQVTALVRRVYLNAIAIKPQIKISGSLIAFGQGPTTDASWVTVGEAYWRVYQDWRAWTEEGILDIAMPMAYKAEHINTGAANVNQQLMFDQWLQWLRGHQYNRAGVIGAGGLSNAIEGTLRQIRRSVTPPATGPNVAGVSIYSMATSNVAVTSNPYAIPPGTTATRSFAEFASGLTTGKSVSGATLYEPAGTTPLFSEPAPVPQFAWKVNPSRGHAMGFAQRFDGSAFDTAAVSIIDNDSGNVVRTVMTDGNGFFGAVDLLPGFYRAQLASGGTSSCVMQVQAGRVAQLDIASPRLTAADMTVITEPGTCASRVTAQPPYVIGICGNYALASTRSDGAALNAPFPRGTTTVTWTATVPAGNVYSATQRINVIEAFPQITATLSVPAFTDPNLCTALVAVPLPATSLGCAGSSLTPSRSITTPFAKGTTTVAWTARDSTGRSWTTDAANSTKVVVTDNERPRITPPADIVASTDAGSCTATVSVGTASATDNCTTVNITATRGDGLALSAPYPKGLTTITWRATDSASPANAATAIQTVTVNDTELPKVTAPPNIAVTTDPGSCAAANVNVGAATATDNCGATTSASRSDGQQLNAPYPKGTTTIIWTATDAAGLSASASQLVTVTDNEPPVIAAPADVNALTATGTCAAAVVLGTPAIGDNCPGATVTAVRSDGAVLASLFPKGMTTVTWTVVDAAGLSATAVQRVTVVDAEPPSIIPPGDRSVTTDAGSCSAVVNAGTPNVSDNCGGATYSSARSDGAALTAPYQKGTTTILWTATDASGLTASATQTITVSDGEPPSITKVKASDKELWPPTHHLVPVTISYETSDNCGGAVTTSLSVASNEPEDGTADGDTAPDFVVVDDQHVQLRAERAATGAGRVYTITVTATDSAGNASTATTTVAVPLSQGNGPH